VGLLERLLQRWRVDHEMMHALRADWHGDTEGAIGQLQSAMAASGSTPDRQNALAQLQCKIGRTEEALSNIAQALADDPGKPEYIVTQVRILRRLGQLDEALSRIEAQYKRDEKNLFVATELSKVLVDMGRMDDASILLDRVEGWFERISETPRARTSGMAQAYREARQKLRQARERKSKAEAGH
jgi:predicted Zn-dependent protease